MPDFSDAPDRARKKMGAPNQIARSIETQLETLLFALYYLKSTYGLFLCPKVFAVRLLKPQRTIFIIQKHPSKGVQKNKLNAWDFTKNKLGHRYFDKKIAENFPKKYSSEWHQTDTFDSSFNDRLMV